MCSHLGEAALEVLTWMKVPAVWCEHRGSSLPQACRGLSKSSALLEPIPAGACAYRAQKEELLLGSVRAEG